MPPSASANLPFLLVSAPVKAPRVCPNSSDSSRFSGIAAQFTLTSGISRCALWKWIARATISLPVPVSPVISTVLFDFATISAVRITSCTRRLRPTMPYWLNSSSRSLSR